MVESKKCSFEEFSKYMCDFWKMQNMLGTLYDLGIVLDNPPLVGYYVEMLQKLMNDKHEWISYYIYETDSGNISGDHVFDQDGKPIPFKDLEDIYRLITAENDESEIL